MSAPSSYGPVSMFAGILAARFWALSGCIAEMETAGSSPCLGGLMLSLWLNSLARRIGAIPNDRWVLKSHSPPHREGQSSHKASPPPSLPPPPSEAGQFNTFFCSLALITIKYSSLATISCSPSTPASDRDLTQTQHCRRKPSFYLTVYFREK